MSIFEPTLAMEYAKGDSDVILLHITTPRPAAIEKARVCIQLREMIPGDEELIGGYIVTRLSHNAHQRRRLDVYKINGIRHTYQDVIDMVETRRKFRPPTAQLALPLEGEAA